MLKKNIICLVFAIKFSSIYAVNIDTLKLYFRNNSLSRPSAVSSLDSADFIRLLIRINPSDKLVTVQDYTKNGQLISISKTDTSYLLNYKNHRIHLIGDAINYYPDGKRESITYYENEEIRSIYFYFPSGKLYFHKKYTPTVYGYYGYLGDELYIDCYDIKGNPTCKDGNGRWLIYDDKFSKVEVEGEIKKAHMNGDWTGSIFVTDTIKYILKLKDNRNLGGIGFDKYGKSYPFDKEYEKPDYKRGVFDFMDQLRRNFVPAISKKDRKMFLDTAHFLLIIERDGKTESIQTVGNIDPQVKDALLASFQKCLKLWSPTKVYGVPQKTTLLLPLNYEHGYVDYGLNTHGDHLHYEMNLEGISHIVSDH